MNFTKVPKQVQPYILKLTNDDVFLQRYDTDEVLNQLDQLKYNPFIQFNQLQLIFHNKLKFNVVQNSKQDYLDKSFFQTVKDYFHKLFCKTPLQYVQLKPITLALWSYLYTIKSPIIFEEKKISTVDIDMFFYLLETKNFTSPDVVLQKSLNFCNKNLPITGEQLKYVFQKLLKISFRALNMFPKYKLEGGKPAFNVDWLTSIATKVVQVSNYNIQQVYSEISVCQAYYLFAQFCREKGSEAIYLRTEDEIMQEEDLRSCVLIAERLIELGAINKKDKEFYIDLMHSQEEQEKKDGC